MNVLIVDIDEIKSEGRSLQFLIQLSNATPSTEATALCLWNRLSLIMCSSEWLSANNHAAAMTRTKGTVSLRHITSTHVYKTANLSCQFHWLSPIMRFHFQFEWLSTSPQNNYAAAMTNGTATYLHLRLCVRTVRSFDLSSFSLVTT